MKKWQKILAASITCGMAMGFYQPATEAAYQLNSEVKAPTKALKAASEIGVLVNENKDMANLANKDAIVVMTFGTTFKDTREKLLMLQLKKFKLSILTLK